MLPPSIRAVVFDAVGTVIHPVPPAAIVYAETARRFGVSVSPTEVAARFLPAIAVEDDLDRAADWVTSEDRERNRWQRVVTAVLPGTPPKCFEELFVHFARADAWRVEPETVSVLHSLVDRGLELGLASNYDARLRSVLSGLTELNFLTNRVVISSEVGVRKPGRGFFAAVSAAMEIPAEQIAFVGDDRMNDFDGARAAGMRVILFDPDDRHPTESPRVRSLTDLI